MITPASSPSGSVLAAPLPPGVQVGEFRTHRDAAAALDHLVTGRLEVVVDGEVADRARATLSTLREGEAHR